MGKTSIIRQYIYQDPLDYGYYPTYDTDLHCKIFTNKDGITYYIKIWDDNPFKKLDHALKKVDGIILAYNTTEPKTFESLNNWIELINQNANANVGKILVGNKVDLEDKR